MTFFFLFYSTKKTAPEKKQKKIGSRNNKETHSRKEYLNGRKSNTANKYKHTHTHTHENVVKNRTKKVSNVIPVWFFFGKKNNLSLKNFANAHIIFFRSSHNDSSNVIIIIGFFSSIS